MDDGRLLSIKALHSLDKAFQIARCEAFQRGQNEVSARIAQHLLGLGGGHRQAGSACGKRGHDARRGVFDDHSVAGCNPQSFESNQEDLRIRFTLDDILS
jgi:hypothetical protein